MLQSTTLKKIFTISIWLIIAIGILLRLILFFQNRNLIIDEANVVRNLYERDFSGLLLPLKYEQYAPPVFLWIEELFSVALGFSEKAMRLYPLLCGIASLFVFRKIMQRYVDDLSLWLPLALMAFSPYLIEHSTSVKQYLPDVLIVLILVLLALQKDMFSSPRGRFIFSWGVIGIIAIASSMPSVFALAGVGLYYAWQCLRAKKWKYIFPLLAIGMIWLAAFGVYYLYILKPQINSDYLQNYHADYFLFATPSNAEEWKHNWMRIEEILSNVGGYTFFNFLATCIFIVTGFISFLRKRTDVLILFFIPVLLTLVAAALNQFSLIMRVSLFLLPLLLLLFGYGFHQFWKIKWLPVKILLVVIGVIMISAFNDFRLFREKRGFHEITAGFDYLGSQHATGEQVYIHDASVPTYIYYTEIHPERDRYNFLLNAHRMKWDSDYTQETKDITGTVYFLYTGGFPESEKQKRTAQVEQNLKHTAYFEKYVAYVFGYVKKE